MIAPLPIVAAATIAATPMHMQVGLGQSFEQHEMVITPIGIVEDSRCPEHARCIQEGRLVLNVRIDRDGKSEDHRLALGEMMPVGDHTLFFSFATPPQSGLDLESGAHFGFILTTKVPQPLQTDAA